MNNKCFWRNEFTLSNTTIISKTGLSLSALQRARNELVQKGLIKYQKAKNQYNAGLYSIKVLSQYEQANDTALATALVTAPDMANDTAPDHINKTNTKTKTKTNTYKEKDKKETPNIPNEIVNEWNDYVQMRKEIKKPLTSVAGKQALDKLNTLALNDFDKQKAILNQSTFNSWQGLFELKGGYNNDNSQHRRDNADSNGEVTAPKASFGDTY